MVYSLVKAKVTEVIYAQLEQGEDLYDGIMEICRRENIKTGLVLNIVGALTRARLSMPAGSTAANAPAGCSVWEGQMIECSGVGIIGQTVETLDTRGSAEIFHAAGDPYLHIHLTITVAGKTYMGHLIDGCIVRSLHRQSHFTIALAKCEGATVNLRVKPPMDNYPRGVPVHELIQN